VEKWTEQSRMRKNGFDNLKDKKYK
jgi:hypothetical protein